MRVVPPTFTYCAAHLCAHHFSSSELALFPFTFTSMIFAHNVAKCCAYQGSLFAGIRVPARRRHRPYDKDALLRGICLDIEGESCAVGGGFPPSRCSCSPCRSPHPADGIAVAECAHAVVIQVFASRFRHFRCLHAASEGLFRCFRRLVPLLPKTCSTAIAGHKKALRRTVCR